MTKLEILYLEIGLLTRGWIKSLIERLLLKLLTIERKIAGIKEHLNESRSSFKEKLEKAMDASKNDNEK